MTDRRRWRLASGPLVALLLATAACGREPSAAARVADGEEVYLSNCVPWCASS